MKLSAWCLRANMSGPGASFVSPDVRAGNPGWGDEDKFRHPLESLEFALPTGHRIVMSGYRAYNFFIEVRQSLGGRGKPRLEAIYLAGEFGGQVDMWKIQHGRIWRAQKPWGREYGGGATRGWRDGAPVGKPQTRIIENT